VKNEMDWHVARIREWRGVHRVLVGKLEGKRTRGRHRRRWEDDNMMDRQEVGYVGFGLDRARSE
jgi:hypothetical protein